jgi:uncharacterized protein YdaU (DUF1376 family)
MTRIGQRLTLSSTPTSRMRALDRAAASQQSPLPDARWVWTPNDRWPVDVGARSVRKPTVGRIGAGVANGCEGEHMNFFKLYIGDYQRDTAHLSLTEHGAYLLMLQHYYATEKPLPTGRTLHRMLRAQDKADRDAIDSVASAFWLETPAGLVNKRADEEIAKSEHQRTVNREIGKRGGRPSERKTESETESVSEPEPNGNPSQTPDTIPPDTRHQPSHTNTFSVSEVVVGGAGEGDASPKQDARKRAPTPPKRPDDVDERVWQDWIALRKSKKAAVSETVLRAAQREADKAGMTLTEFLELWCLRGSQGLQADWIKPQERGALGQQIETFRERDERLARERIDEMTGRARSKSLPQSVPMADVIDIAPCVALFAK